MTHEKILVSYILIKLKPFARQKTLERIKTQATDWEKLFANTVSGPPGVA